MKKHPHPRSSRRTAALILAGSIAALLVPRLSAQTTITYTNGQTDATAYDTSAPNDPTTLTIASGSATQSGILSGTGAIIKDGAGTLTLSAINTYAGPTTLREGILSVATVGPSKVGSNLGGSGSPAANLVFDGGTLRYTGATASTIRNFTINAGKTATFDITTNNLTVSGASIATNGALTKTGAGTLTLSGANLHSGDTTVHAGTLKLNLSGSISNSAAIIVGDAGSTGTHLDVTTKTGGLTIGLAQTLKGIGQIDGNTTILGTHAPGNSPGLQTFNGNLAYSTGAMLNWELAANVSTDTSGVRGAFFDGVDVLSPGALSIASGVISNLIFNGAGSAVNFSNAFWTSSHSWQVYSDANLPTLSSSAIFDTINVSTDSLGATLSGGNFSWSEVGNDVFLNYEVTGVPEPGTALFGIACFGVAALRRRRSA